MQKELLDQVISRYKKRSLAIDALTQYLKIGKDAVYRRIRGESLLTPEEISLIAKKYGISLDELVFNKTNKVVFYSANKLYNVRNNLDFLHFINSRMKNANEIAGNQFYAAYGDLPIFLSSFYPALMEFKLFVWGKTVWKLPHVEFKKFSLNNLSQPEYDEISKMAKFYCALPGEELWSTNFLDNTLYQIEYYLGADEFKHTKDVYQLLDTLSDLLDHIQMMARVQKKCMPGTEAIPSSADFELYHNELVHTSTTILAVAPSAKSLYAGIGNPNYIITSDQKMCEFKFEWFDRLRKKSSLLSGNAEKNRKWFFSRMQKRIQVMKKRIDIIINELI